VRRRSEESRPCPPRHIGPGLPEVNPRRNRRDAKALLCNEQSQEGQIDTYNAHKTTTEVRQGSRTLDNFWVLVISTVAIVAVFAIIYLVFAANTPPSVISP
jgi:anti-sigma-K factor RskA